MVRHDKIVIRSWQEQGKNMQRSWPKFLQDHAGVLQDHNKIMANLMATTWPVLAGSCNDLLGFLFARSWQAHDKMM